MQIIEHGLYNIKDKYFEDFKCDFMTDNKHENRPFYYCFSDAEGNLWFIPLSSQTEHYQLKIDKDTKRYGDCLFYHIGKINGIDRVFLIGNMIPIIEKYIKKPYTISDMHYVVANKKLIKAVQKKAKKYLALIKYGNLTPNIDIMKIKHELHK